MRLPSIHKVKDFFPNHRKEYVSNFLLLSNSIFQAKSVNLSKCKKQVGILTQDSTVNVANVYTKFIRLFKMPNIGLFCIGIALLILDLIKDLEENKLLIIDRTNWKLGKVNDNILQMGIGLTNGIMIPLLGVPLIDKRGNSNVDERKGLLNLFLRFAPLLVGSYTIVGDREFIGKEWFKHILSLGHNFVIRLRSKDYKSIIAEEINRTPEQLEKRIRRSVRRNGYYFQSFEMDGNQMFLLVVKNKKNRKDPFVRLISNKENIEEILADYDFRWSIEVYFRKTKTDGFNLEDLRLTDPNKVFLMAVIVGFLYVKAIIAGLEEHTKKDVKKQYFKNRDKAYFRESFFQTGMNILSTCILNLSDWINSIQQRIHEINNKIFERFKDLKDKNIPTMLESIMKNV